ncbi:MAG: HAMP domain-containing histidine kinase [Firmicutes bacterium]|nr:HAMP domain-containing histidine kinase [Bacillota bacterium]
MKINRRKRRKSKFFGIMVRDLLIFLTVSLILSTVIAGAMVYQLFIKKNELFDSPYNVDEEMILSGNYNEYDVTKALGEGSYFFVFDENHSIIYQSDESKQFPFDERTMLLLPNEDERFDVNHFGFKTIEGKKAEMLSRWDDSVGGRSLIIVDNENNILFSNFLGIEGQLTDLQYQAISGQMDDYKIIKDVFKSESGGYHTAVYFNYSDKKVNFDSQSAWKLLAIVVTLFIVFIMSLLLYLIHLWRKVRKPLLLLEEAVNKFEIGKSEKIQYRGPREFVEICDKFNEMSERLNEAEKIKIQTQEEKQKFLSDISHDLKTPIAVIQGYSKAISDGVVPEEEKEEFLQTIYKKSMGLGDLINTFSEYSKMERPDYSLKLEKTDIVAFIRDYLISKYNELEFLGFSMEINLPDEKIYSQVDHFQMTRVLENIISNSVKHNKSGTKIYVEFKKETNHIEFKIGDNGVGIDNELRKDFFKPLIIGDKSRTEGKGSGLGTAIMEKIVALHGGSIELIAEEDTELSLEYIIKLPLDV